MQAQLTLLDRKGEPHNLRQKEFDEASETLGVHIAMNGNQTGLIESLKEKADLFAERVCTIPSDFNTVQYVYEVSLMPQLGYCFAAQSIPKSSWKYIMKKAKKQSFKGREWQLCFLRKLSMVQLDMETLVSKTHTLNKESSN